LVIMAKLRETVVVTRRSSIEPNFNLMLNRILQVSSRKTAKLHLVCHSAPYPGDDRVLLEQFFASIILGTKGRALTPGCLSARGLAPLAGAGRPAHGRWRRAIVPFGSDEGSSSTVRRKSLSTCGDGEGLNADLSALAGLHHHRRRRLRENGLRPKVRLTPISRKQC
jgi:hypothetical protein